MNIANQLTVGRVLLVFVFMGIIWNPWLPLETTLWIALAIFVIASLTDFLDGYLARKYKLVTNLGKFMDPLADKMLVTAAMIALVDLSHVLPAGVLPAWIVVVILLREFAVSGIRLLAANCLFNTCFTYSMAIFRANSCLCCISFNYYFRHSISMAE